MISYIYNCRIYLKPYLNEETIFEGKIIQINENNILLKNISVSNIIVTEHIWITFKTKNYNNINLNININQTLVFLGIPKIYIKGYKGSNENKKLLNPLVKDIGIDLKKILYIKK